MIAIVSTPESTSRADLRVAAAASMTLEIEDPESVLPLPGTDDAGANGFQIGATGGDGAFHSARLVSKSGQTVNYTLVLLPNSQVELSIGHENIEVLQEVGKKLDTKKVPIQAGSAQSERHIKVKVRQPRPATP